MAYTTRTAILLRMKRILKQLLGKEPWIYPTVECPRVFIGSEGEGWCITPANLSEDSIAYSFGVGQDISFDVSLIEKYGVTVHAFDPTPQSVKWIQTQTLPDKFHFHPFGIADHDGAVNFYPHKKASNVCYSVFERDRVSEGFVELPVYTFRSIRKMLGHEKIDLLKLDIEGAEHAVLNDMLDENYIVPQLLVEFHHRFRGISVNRTRTLVRRLRQHGFGVFYISLKGREYSFIHQALAE